jgi:hypothetical protein
MDIASTQKTRWFERRPSARTQAVLGVLLVALVLLIVLFDWNWFKRPLENAVQSRTGRALHIDGNLDVDLGRVTKVTAERIRFANASWSKEPVMASADRIEVDIEIWPFLLRRETRIPAIRLATPRLRLETGPDDQGNWRFGRDSDGDPIRFGGIRIEKGRLQYFDARKKTDIDIRVNSAKPDKNDRATPHRVAPHRVAPPIDVEGKGRWSGNAFTLSGRGDSPLQLTDAAKPYRIDLRATAGPTRAHARGTLVDPFRLRDFDLRLMLSGENLYDLYPLIGVVTPATPPYRFDGRLTRNADTWRYDAFTGLVGDSDLSGSAAVTVGRVRPLLVADLVSKRLDFDDLAGFIGAPPQTGGQEATNAELRA